MARYKEEKRIYTKGSNQSNSDFYVSEAYESKPIVTEVYYARENFTPVIKIGDEEICVQTIRTSWEFKEDELDIAKDFCDILMLNTRIPCIIIQRFVSEEGFKISWCICTREYNLSRFEEIP